MNSKRLLLAGGILFLFALAWNAFVHLFVLAGANARVQHLRRPDLADKLWLSLLLTAGVVALFIAGYARIARTGTRREGAAYGIGFACLAGLLVDLSQHLLYPIPGAVAALWFAAGLVEFTVYGLLIAQITGRTLRHPIVPPPYSIATMPQTSSSGTVSESRP